MRKLLSTFPLLLVLAGCGSQTPDVSGATSQPNRAISVPEVVAGRDGRYVSISGYVLWDDVNARLCEVLLESFPPQCGGLSVVIVDPIQLDSELQLEEELGVRWTDNEVVIGGYFEDGQLLLLEQTDAED